MFSDLASYYYRWYHPRPVLITPQRRDELRRLHAILVKCCRHFAGDWSRWLPLGVRETAILQEQARHPLRLGTWRPDYLAATDGSLRLCEITSRFFGHGIFLSWFARAWAQDFLKGFPGAECSDRYPELMDKMLALAAGRPRMYVFKSSDRTSEIRLYRRFYEAHDIDFFLLEAEEVERRREEWDLPECTLISALNQKDIMAMGDDTLQAMMDRGIISDMRNVFLVHDKRFMQLWFDDAFTRECLTAEETAFLREHAIPTYALEDRLEDALAHKDDYIIKPCRLGKSEGVHAGVLTSKAEWRRLLRKPQGYIIQPFIPQRSFPTEWEGTPYRDYLCGMMLCVDDEYYDSGLFRFSSLPVTNVGDDRKAAMIHSASPELIPYCDVL
ncbi:MAG: hypothetical protein IK031_03610 [Bacteroidales bacterium]|nr:hypothetical protein [Bacteroidales bacterium]